MASRGPIAQRRHRCQRGDGSAHEGSGKPARRVRVLEMGLSSSKAAGDPWTACQAGRRSPTLAFCAHSANTVQIS